MGEVVNIGCITRLDLPVDLVLDAAKEQLDSVLLLGHTKDGEQYFASTMADKAEILWLLEQCKKELLE